MDFFVFHWTLSKLPWDSYRNWIGGCEISAFFPTKKFFFILWNLKCQFKSLTKCFDFQNKKVTVDNESVSALVWREANHQEVIRSRRRWIRQNNPNCSWVKFNPPPPPRFSPSFFHLLLKRKMNQNKVLKIYFKKIINLLSHFSFLPPTW